MYTITLKNSSEFFQCYCICDQAVVDSETLYIFFTCILSINKECDNYMKQMFKTCENAYKIFYHIIFLEICKSYKIIPKGLYVKKDYCIGNPSTEFCDN